MTSPNPPDALEAQARRRVGLKTGFYAPLTIYLLVNAGLFAIAWLTGRGHWPVFALLGWGLGLAIHGIVVLLKLRGEGLRERMVASEIERLRRRP